ncbi:MAG: DUF3667 domain-containing protein [Alloprevotella sp.]
MALKIFSSLSDTTNVTSDAPAPPSVAPDVLNAPHRRCLNCGTEFEGNFCPLCGQSAGVKRFTVKSVLTSTLDVWGMGNRSMPRTIFRLFFHPGKMIGDYLDGKRMPYFPPVKMLFVLCIFFALANLGEHTLSQVADLPQTIFQGEQPEQYEAIKDRTILDTGLGSITFENSINAFKSAAKWFDSHKAVSLLLLHLFFTFFTWLVFRKAPARPRTTLAENFFIQVFISGQMVTLSLLHTLLFGHKSGSVFYPLPGWLLFLLFTWDFKELFGYGWRKTVWKTFLVHFLFFLFFLLVLILTLAVISYTLYGIEGFKDFE